MIAFHKSWKEIKNNGKARPRMVQLVNCTPAHNRTINKCGL